MFLVDVRIFFKGFVCGVAPWEIVIQGGAQVQWISSGIGEQYFFLFSVVRLFSFSNLMVYYIICECIHKRWNFSS